MLHPISQEAFEKTLVAPMVNVLHSAGPVVNIWPYVQEMVAHKIVHPHVYRNQVVEAVYRNTVDGIDHVLLPTSDPSTYHVIVVDLTHQKVMGHYLQKMINDAS